MKAVRESDGGTKADEGVQRLIRCRIEGYPEKATADMHHARSVSHGRKAKLHFMRDMLAQRHSHGNGRDVPVAVELVLNRVTPSKLSLPQKG